MVFSVSPAVIVSIGVPVAFVVLPLPQYRVPDVSARSDEQGVNSKDAVSWQWRHQLPNQAGDLVQLLRITLDQLSVVTGRQGRAGLLLFFKRKKKTIIFALYIQEVAHQRITLHVTQITVILTLSNQVEIWYVAFYA